MCDSDRIRTCDRLLRRQMLYPAELPNHAFSKEAMQETTLRVVCQVGSQKVVLIFKNDKVVLNAFKNADNSFCFSRNNECGIQLPFVPAYLIALGEQDGQLLFAQKEIQIGENEVEELELKPSTEAEVSVALQGIEAGYER